MSGDWQKITSYFGERDRTTDRLLADELLSLYGSRGIETSVLLRGVSGFGLEHHLRTDQLLSISEDLPLVCVALDTRERIDALLPEVMALQRRGLVTVERVGIAGGAAPAVPPQAEPPGAEPPGAEPPGAEPPAARPPQDLGETTKLTVYVGREQRVGGAAAFRVVCDLLHRHGLAGATALLGVDGTMHGRRARARLLRHSPDVPMMISSVGASELIVGVLPELAALSPSPTLTLERVRLCKRDGRPLAEPEELPGVDEHGLEIWQKLSVHTSESARHDGRPLHRALVQRLRAANVAGATTLRGIWGFHGDHAPHGDRLLQVYRHVPVVTTVIDRPQRIAKAFRIIDELTAERGLVTSELVPVATAMGERIRTGNL